MFLEQSSWCFTQHLLPLAVPWPSELCFPTFDHRGSLSCCGSVKNWAELRAQTPQGLLGQAEREQRAPGDGNVRSEHTCKLPWL